MSRPALLALMSRPALLALACGGLGACGGPETVQAYTVVTVDGVPAVHDVNLLRVTLSNSGSERTDELVFTGAFPFTFSVSAPEREGELGIQIDAFDDNDFIVGQGSTTAQIDDPAASVMLDSTDFVVNTDFAGDQYPSDDYEAHGFQVAAGSDGTWTAAYRDACTQPCNMFARRFDVTGKPVSTRAAAGINGFPMNSNPADFPSTPAIATAGPATLEVWDFSEPSPSTVDGVACRSLDTQGNPTPNQLNISTDPSTDVVSITPLSNMNFAVAWNSFMMTNTIRAAIVRPDCTVLTGPVNVSTVTTGGPRKASVASNPTSNKIMYAWVLSGSVRVRIASLTNAFDIGDTEFLPPTATEIVEHARVAPLGDGFAILVRWTLSTGFEGPGRIELYRTNAAGAVIGSPTLVTTKSGTDFQSSEAFGVATSASGKLFVTWHACEANGDGQGCGVYGRAFNSDGTPASDEMTIPTTIVGDQTNPSVAALPNDAFAVVWRDDSMQAPDTAGSAIRARIVYIGNGGN
ncbi:MAG: hypothetical protein AB7T06_05095 [Kofleriaceae bacterium]